MIDNKLSILDDKIKNKIHTIRSLQVMLDKDLAELYKVPTKRLNEQVKRNIERFPTNFMFQLNREEKDELVAKCDHLKLLKHSSQQPYAFTEQGVAMLSGVLRSDTAIKVSIQIITAFIAMRKFILKNADIFARLDSVERKQLEYKIKSDEKFNKIFSAIESKDIKPKKGIFFNGQIFDAYNFVSDIIRSAEKSIILLDNFVDDSVLTVFNILKRTKNYKFSDTFQDILN